MKVMLTLVATALLLPFATSPATALLVEARGPMGPNDAPDVRCEDYSSAEIAESFGLMTETFPTATPGMTVTVHMLCMTDLVDEVAPLTDCTAKAYSLTGWRWATPYNAQWDTTNPYGLSSSAILSAMNAAGNAWDQPVAADTFGSMSQGGSASNIRRQDFVNQQGFKNLGGGGTIAVTYTWSYNDGRAAESDAAYNTYFRWSTSGASNAMDLQAIGTHEMGHTHGMGHTPTGSANQCLTMYPYGDYGQTYQRTLGDGDLLGIDAIY